MNKKDIDREPGYEWIFSYKKFAGWLIFISAVLFFVYAMMRSDTESFLRTFLVYAMISLIVVAIFTIVYGATKGAYAKLKGFLIAWVLIFVTYLVLGWIMQYAFNINFNYGYGAWVLMLTLAGFHKIDGKIDSRDVFYAMVVVIAIIGANIPFGVGGHTVLDVFTEIVEKIFSFIGILKTHHISWDWNNTKGLFSFL